MPTADAPQVAGELDPMTTALARLEEEYAEARNDAERIEDFDDFGYPLATWATVSCADLRLVLDWIADQARHIEALTTDKMAAEAEVEQLKADMERLHDSLNQAEAGWRPIESAPRDGTQILVHSEEGPEVVLWDGATWLTPDYAVTFPVHWMSLPPLPDAEKGE